MKVSAVGWIVLAVAFAAPVSAYAGHYTNEYSSQVHHTLYAPWHGHTAQARYHIFTRNPHRCNVSLCVAY